MGPDSLGKVTKKGPKGQLVKRWERLVSPHVVEPVNGACQGAQGSKAGVTRTAGACQDPQQAEPVTAHKDKPAHSSLAVSSLSDASDTHGKSAHLPQLEEIRSAEAG
ncbi:hypothetical protein H920_06894 [Fukomys damarensis]|uniref:Uncharacterized protein n=1 Tax=Fukomys damarensis TaxID=885580 RepID=A0A091DN84_FUKDA|nr:hypothetical protein H920_06894 [Fukomys damarensis]